ncbi:MAG: 16S rRNA (cytosine(1402)-N(4))-methyltransferase RsmH [Firmicutes bacterium]|nr:16S rRNA (cytosine(1402)-N(4))-methyltransferase RsmH [Bacillota bacterium]
MDYSHIPVLTKEVLDMICCREDGGIYVDATVGGGGHAYALLEKAGSGAHLFAFDQDKAALRAAGAKLQDKAKQVTFIHANFVYMTRELAARQIDAVDGILFDLGVSSHQLDTKGRGFSYHYDAPLDMRMDQSLPFTAADLVANYSEEELALIISKYGEERWAKRIAEFIVQERSKTVIQTTHDLVQIIKAAIPAGARRDGPHPARRTFQALRIAVNRELEYLEQALLNAAELLKPQGRIVVISFHSLEDRIVKDTFRNLARGCQCPRDLPVCVCGKEPLLKVLTPRPVLPRSTEVAQNPRARSAKLRAAERVLGKERDEY